MCGLCSWEVERHRRCHSGIHLLKLRRRDLFWSSSERLHKLRRRGLFWDCSARLYKLCSWEVERHRRCHSGIHLLKLRRRDLFWSSSERLHKLRRRNLFWDCSARLHKLCSWEVERHRRCHGGIHLLNLPTWKVQRAIWPGLLRRLRNWEILDSDWVHLSDYLRGLCSW